MDLPPPLPPQDNIAPPVASYALQVAGESGQFKSQIGNNSSIHAFSEAEKAAFVKHINESLSSFPELSSKLPINPSSNDIFEAVKDGILLW